MNTLTSAHSPQRVLSATFPLSHESPHVIHPIQTLFLRSGSENGHSLLVSPGLPGIMP